MSANLQTAETAQAPTLSEALTDLKPEVEKVLPAHVTPDKFMRVVMTAISQTPDLYHADRRSLLTSCVKAAQDGLLPDGREAALVIFNTKDKVTDENGRQVDRWVKKAQYMPMVAGILKKVRNSGELLSIVANVVYEQDEFNYWVDDAGEHILWKPNLLAEDRGRLLAVYAQAKTKDGGVYVEAMTRGQIEQVRNVSKAKDSGPWKGWYDEMARKTCIRRLSKRLPMSTDLETVVTRDDEMYDPAKASRQLSNSGVSAARALLGVDGPGTGEDEAGDEGEDLPPAAAEGESVDTETGEVTGAAVPHYDAESAVKALESKRNTKTLDELWSQIEADFLNTDREIPLEVSAKYTELYESLEQKESEA